MTWLFVVAVVGSLFFGLTRPFIKPHGVSKEDIYKDMAHVFVGLLIGAGWVYYQLNGNVFGFARNENPYFTMAAIITAVEVVSALWNRRRKHHV